jgi:GNAT superfamily N-acetyltransferase
MTVHVSSADGAAMIWPLYRSVFGDHDSFESWREGVWDRHRARAGFRPATAYDGETLIGFAYGYTDDDGQWWTDNARRVLAPSIAAAWLGGHFEVVSVGVLASARGAGVGRSLMRSLLDGLPHTRLLLMTTDDPADPARRLYASPGWQVIGPGIGDATVIMGKRAAADR